MAENYRDTPATYEQNRVYQNNPHDDNGKPYSTRQQASNESNADKVWLYHPELGEERYNYGKVFRRSEVEDALADGWMESAPLHPKEKERGITLADKLGTKTVEKAEDDEPATDTVEALRVEYQNKTGKAPDKRWGESRLIEELKAA